MPNAPDISDADAAGAVGNITQTKQSTEGPRRALRMYYVSDGSPGTTRPDEEMLTAANELQSCVDMQIVSAAADLSGGDSSSIDAILIDAQPQDLPSHFARAQRSLGGRVARVACVPSDAPLALCLACVRLGADALLPQPISAAALAGLWQHCLRRDPTSTNGVSHRYLATEAGHPRR